MVQVTPERVTQAADSVASDFGDLWAGLAGAGDVWMKLAFTVVVIGAVVLLRRLFLGVLERRAEDVRTRYRWAKISAYLGFGLVLLFGIVIWTGGELAPFGTFLGLLTAGLAIALRDLVSNLAGWLFILWRRPFDLGDRIQVGEHAGDVVDIRVFQFTMLEIGNWVAADQSTGRIIHVPNQKVFSDALANYTSQFEYLWNEVVVVVTFESDWQKARDILVHVAEEKAGGVGDEVEREMRKAARKFLISYQKLSPTVYVDVVDSGIRLTIRYLCRPRARRGTAQSIWEAVLQEFHGHEDIDFAYPTYRAYFNPLEGKPGARAEMPDVAGQRPSPGGGAFPG